MNVLIVEPMKEPYESDIESGLESLQKAVGGYIEAVYPFDDPVGIICNEEGKLIGLPLNRCLRDSDGNIYDVLAGKFLVVGLGEEGFTDLPPQMMEKYKKYYKDPERFMRLAGQMTAVKCPIQAEKKAQKAHSEFEL